MGRIPNLVIFSISLLIAAIAMAPVNAASNAGYFPSGSAAADHVRDAVLIYNGKRYQGIKWTPQNLDPYVAYYNRDNRPVSWFFDTFLFLGLTSQSGDSLCPGFGSHPSDISDWRWYLDSKLSGGENDLANLNQSLINLQRVLHKRSHHVKVIIVIPYPDPNQHQFGVCEGSNLDFANDADRLKAVTWYVNAVLKRWKRAKLNHLRLIGFYWIEEEASNPADQSLLPLVGKLLRDHHKKFYWIPYFNAPGAGNWKSLGFDCAFYQPNYFFHNLPSSRIQDAAQFAREHRMGIEIECDYRYFSTGAFRRRYLGYMDGGIRFGYMKRSACAFYEGAGALLESCQSSNPTDRELYRLTYRFVKKTYRPANPPAGQ